MLKRILVFVTLVAILNVLMGCTKTVTYSPEEFSKRVKPNTSIYQVVKKIGLIVRFVDGGGRYFPEERIIKGSPRVGEYVEIPLDDVSQVMIKRTRVLASLALVGITAVLIVAIASADGSSSTSSSSTTESCPLIYSWDGEKFKLDAEPLGGATSKAFERTDYSLLEHLKPGMTGYDLVVRNEMQEIQYIDEMSLLIIDHEPDLKVAPNGEGSLDFYRNPNAPLAATDENGNSIMQLIQFHDSVTWLTEMPVDKSSLEDDYRHHLTFQFERPEGATTARLVYTSGTSLWGSKMIRHMLQARGSGVDGWYEAMEKGGPQLLATYAFFDREELFWLKVDIDNGKERVNRGLILGGGPLVTETRVVKLNIADIPGDTLTIHLNPPKGFWSIDYVGLDFSTTPVPEFTEIQVANAHNEMGRDVSSLIQTKDGLYHVMPDTSNWVKMHFDMSSQHSSLERSIFLKTSGYYNLILDKSMSEDTELIRRIAINPGEIVNYALEEYILWADSLLAAK